MVHTIETESRSDSSVQKTLSIEGNVVSSKKSRLQSLLLETLLSCDHLVVNFDKVTRFDSELLVLICSVDRTTQRLDKKLTINGKGSRAFTTTCKKSLCPKNDACLLENCFLLRMPQGKSGRSLQYEKNQQ